jgi:hypothetical protein
MMRRTVKPRSASQPWLCQGKVVFARVQRAVLKKGADARMPRICIVNVVIDAANLKSSRANNRT